MSDDARCRFCGKFSFAPDIHPCAEARAEGRAEGATERRALRDALALQISYLGHQDQDADHGWMVRKMREALAQQPAPKADADARLDVFNTLRRHGLYDSPAYRELRERYERAQPAPKQPDLDWHLEPDELKP